MTCAPINIVRDLLEIVRKQEFITTQESCERGCCYKPWTRCRECNASREGYGDPEKHDDDCKLVTLINNAENYIKAEAEQPTNDKLPDIMESALFRLRNHKSFDGLADLIMDKELCKLTSETRGKLATFLRSFDDEGLGAYVAYLLARENIYYECKDYMESFKELTEELKGDMMT